MSLGQKASQLKDHRTLLIRDAAASGQTNVALYRRVDQERKRTVKMEINPMEEMKMIRLTTSRVVDSVALAVMDEEVEKEAVQEDHEELDAIWVVATDEADVKMAAVIVVVEVHVVMVVAIPKATTLLENLAVKAEFNVTEIVLVVQDQEEEVAVSDEVVVKEEVEAAAVASDEVDHVVQEAIEENVVKAEDRVPVVMRIKTKNSINHLHKR